MMFCPQVVLAMIMKILVKKQIF